MNPEAGSAERPPEVSEMVIIPANGIGNQPPVPGRPDCHSGDYVRLSERRRAQTVLGHDQDDTAEMRRPCLRQEDSDGGFVQQRGRRWVME